MFENKFKKFQESIAKTPPNSAIVDADDTICVVINPNEKGIIDSHIEPTFDNDFDSFNFVKEPIMASKTVLSSQKPTRKEVVVNTVQVRNVS